MSNPKQMMSMRKPEGPKVDAMTRLNGLEARLKDFEKNFQNLTVFINTQLNRMYKLVSDNTDNINALVSCVGTDAVTEALVANEIVKKEEEAKVQQARLADLIKEGNLVVVDKARGAVVTRDEAGAVVKVDDPGSILEIVEYQFDGTAIAPGWFVIEAHNFMPEYWPQIDGAAVGDEISTFTFGPDRKVVLNEDGTPKMSGGKFQITRILEPAPKIPTVGLMSPAPAATTPPESPSDETSTDSSTKEQ